LGAEGPQGASRSQGRTQAAAHQAVREQRDPKNTHQLKMNSCSNSEQQQKLNSCSNSDLRRRRLECRLAQGVPRRGSPSRWTLQAAAHRAKEEELTAQQGRDSARVQKNYKNDLNNLGICRSTLRPGEGQRRCHSKCKLEGCMHWELKSCMHWALCPP